MRRLAWIVLTIFLSGNAFAKVSAPGHIFYTDVPPVAMSGKAKAARDRSPRIEYWRKYYVERAKSGKAWEVTKKDKAQEAEYDKLVAALRTKLLARTSDKPIMLVIEGQDQVGKSSFIRRVAKAFKGTRFEKSLVIVHNGVPPKGHEDVHWTLRHYNNLPAKGTARIMDRFLMGRAMYDRYYGFIDDAEQEASIKDMKRMDGQIARTHDVVKIYFYASADRRAKTIAKREVLVERTAAKPNGRVGEEDYDTFANRKTITKYADKAIKGTSKHIKWHRISMTDRHEGRVKAFEVVDKVLFP